MHTDIASVLEHIVWWVFFVSVAVTAVCAILVVAGTLVGAWLEVGQSPRQDAFVCDVHGMMPESALITLWDDMEVNGIRGPVKYCPLCMRDREQQARKGFGL